MPRWLFGRESFEDGGGRCGSCKCGSRNNKRSVSGHCGRVVIAKNIGEEIFDDLFLFHLVVEWAMELVFGRIQSDVDFLQYWNGRVMTSRSLKNKSSGLLISQEVRYLHIMWFMITD